MNIPVIGPEFVGLVSEMSFAEIGNYDIWLDIDSIKIEKLEQGIISIF